jgi:hypothetical protein
VEKSTIVKWLGIFVLIVMGASMFAAIFLYNPQNSTPSSDEDAFPVATSQDKQFSYSLAFDTNVLKELSLIKFAALTNLYDIGRIDSSVMKIQGVSKISSEFRKDSMDANEWVYYAEISLKKDADSASAAQSIFDLNYFNHEAGYDARKYVSIAAPPSILIHNTDLNVDRNFVFTQSTLPALASLGTSINDELSVTGTIVLQGKAIIDLQVIEAVNKTRSKLYEDLVKQLQADQNKPLDTNSPGSIGTNKPTDSNKP